VAHKARLFGNRWLLQTTCAGCVAEDQAIFFRRRHQPPPAKIRSQQKRAGPIGGWMMKASTQLIDDLAGVGLPSDEPGIFNFVINDHTIAVFWKPLAFFGQPMVMAQKSGRCDLRV
jgi:hypothetical protein